jgi:hypothetical protein
MVTTRCLPLLGKEYTMKKQENNQTVISSLQTRQKYLHFGLVGVTLLFTLTACKVEKTQDAKMPDVDVAAKGGKLPDVDVKPGELPDVDVDVKGGQLPKYEVETPDVEVKRGTAEVPYPDVDIDVKQKTAEVPVPDVDITLPKDKEKQG